MFADFDYYKSQFFGSSIKDEQTYNYLGQQACKYIEKYTTRRNDATRSCECALVEYLEKAKQQGNMTSESIPNAYSVSWSSNDISTRNREINDILALYLGDLYSSVGVVRVIN